MSITYLTRHAPSQYSVAYRLNGDPNVKVSLTPEGIASSVKARSLFPSNLLSVCATSEFPRCNETARLIVNDKTDIRIYKELNETPYGNFEGNEFLTYGIWLAEHGPYAIPEGGDESQSDAIRRMLKGIRKTMELPGPRLIVCHGLLVSVIQWALIHPLKPLIDVFLPASSCLEPLILSDTQLAKVVYRLERDLSQGAQDRRGWRVNLGVFPLAARNALATVTQHQLHNHRMRP